MVHEGAPVFTLGGDPDTVDARVADLRVRAERFVAVGDALASVSTSGWTGRAADRFRDRFDGEPERWREAGDGFFTAAAALSSWAGSLRWGRERAEWCRREWARGEAETARARSAHDADVRAGKAEKAAWEADNGPGTFTLTITPFVDSGRGIRDAAVAEFDRVLGELDSASHDVAGRVRAGCAAAPEKRNWLESGLAFVGGVIAGAGEAVRDLGSMLVHLTYAPVFDLVDLATGDLTPEELAARYQLEVEQAEAMWDAARTDPWGFGTNVGKAILDWDTWSDDPARALGHLVPDAVAAVVSGGSLAAATRGGKVLETGGRILMDLSGADLLRGGIRALTKEESLAHLADVDAGRLVESLADVQGARYLRPSETTTRLLLDDVGRVGRESVDGYIERLNPLFTDGAEWQNNCGPCSRAFADTFQGVETRVAPGDSNLGELAEMRAATGTNPSPLRFDPADHADTTAFTTAAYDAVADAASDLPDGSALIVGVDWDGPFGGGHWFNAVVQDGHLTWVDAQTGTLGDWPPSYGSGITGIDVVHRPDGTTAWKELGLD